jgi:alpha-beta hydrolase superfamily lysophospholipase
MQSTTFRLSADDGVSQFVYRWEPEGHAPKAALLLAHGMAEHAARYARLAEELTQAGYVVYAGDHRGHGHTARSAAELGHFADEDGWNRAVQDLHRIRQRIEQEHPGVPLVVMGHSMGSMLVRSYLAQHGAGVAAAVLSGTNGAASAGARVARLIARGERLRLGPRKSSPVLQMLCIKPYNLQFRPTRTENDWLSRDTVEVDKYTADPLCGFPLTVQAWIDVLGGIIDIERGETIARLPKALPFYVFAGQRDSVGANTRGVRWLLERLARAGVADVTHHFYADARHETLNETNRAEVTHDLIAWLDATLARSAGRAA